MFRPAHTCIHFVQHMLVVEFSPDLLPATNTCIACKSCTPLPASLPLPAAAKLIQKVTALQTSEASALQQLSSAQARLASRESALLKAEREVDDVKREVELLKERHHRKLELEQRENRVCMYVLYTLVGEGSIASVWK